MPPVNAEIGLEFQNRLQSLAIGNRRHRFAARPARGGWTSMASEASCRLAPQRPHVWTPGMF